MDNVKATTSSNEIATGEKMRSQSQMVAARRFFAYIVLAVLAIISLFPFVIMIINSTREHLKIMGGFTLIPGGKLYTNYHDLLVKYKTSYPVISGMKNSLFVSACVALVTTYFSCATAYGIYMYNFKGKSFVFKFILAIMMVPTQVSTLGFLDLITNMGLMNSFIPLIIPSVAAPVVFFYMYQSMEATLPYSIVEAARVDGCNEFRTFNTIVIPMMKPAIAVQLIFAFVSTWNNYFVPALVLSDKEKFTVPMVIAFVRNADYMNQNYGVLYALMTMTILPLIIIYLFVSKYIIGGVTSGGVKE